jgi:hypothetical protein
MANKVIYAVYDDPEQLKDGARKLVSNGVKVKDVSRPSRSTASIPSSASSAPAWRSRPSCIGITGTSLACWASPTS